MKQKIEIVENPITGKPTLCLQNWDSIEMVDGYTKEEAEILIEQLQDGIRTMEEELNNRNTVSLFGGDNES
jgi:hypothetical protein